MNDRCYAVCGVVEIDGKVLLVRHTYGSAKGRILLPGGFVQSELPTEAIEREILEETGVTVKARSVIAVQFKVTEWCVVFAADYVSGVPRSDGHENSEVLLLTAEEAVGRGDITNMSREILKNVYGGSTLSESGYAPKSAKTGEYVMFAGEKFGGK